MFLQAESFEITR